MTLMEAYKLWGGKCAYCGCSLDSPFDPKSKKQVPTRDHFVPKSAGGTNNKRNIALACQPCNEVKGSIDPRILVMVWHKLDPEGLVGFIEALGNPKRPRRISRVASWLWPKISQSKSR